MTTIYTNKPKEELPERHKNDLYRTEWNLIRLALATYGPERADRVLDIGAGDGRWGIVAQQMVPGVRILAGVEIEDQPQPAGFTHWYGNTDYMTWEAPYTYDLILSNPPYFLSEPIIRRAWEQLAIGGTMIMLLPLQFQASVGRYQGLWQEIYPYRVGVLARRPSFYGGKTNGTDYGLFVWKRSVWGEPFGTPRMWYTDVLYYDRDAEKEA